jgi:hypothetical protein
MARTITSLLLSPVQKGYYIYRYLISVRCINTLLNSHYVHMIRMLCLTPIAQSIRPAINNTLVLLPSMLFHSQGWSFRNEDNQQTLIIILKTEILKIKEPCNPNTCSNRAVRPSLWLNRRTYKYQQKIASKSGSRFVLPRQKVLSITSG